jgi:MFS family permease
MSLPQEKNEHEDDYNRRVNEHEGYVFITLGLSQILTGFLMNRFAEKFNVFKQATMGTLLVEAAGFVSFMCYYTKSYPLSFLASFLWGCSETFLQTNTGGLIAKVFPGRVEGFSVYRIFFSIGVVSVLLINIALSDQDPYIFLTIILALQTLVTAISLNLRYL